MYIFNVNYYKKDSWSIYLPTLWMLMTRTFFYNIWFSNYYFYYYYFECCSCVDTAYTASMKKNKSSVFVMFVLNKILKEEKFFTKPLLFSTGSLCCILLVVTFTFLFCYLRFFFFIIWCICTLSTKKKADEINTLFFSISETKK